MHVVKSLRDRLLKVYLTSLKTVPAGLHELDKYFRRNGAINFSYHREDNMIVAVSENFRYGSIVTFGKDEQELDQKIKDAILTSFGVPSSYAEEAGIHREGAAMQMAYAAA